MIWSRHLESGQPLLFLLSMSFLNLRQALMYPRLTSNSYVTEGDLGLMSLWTWDYRHVPYMSPNIGNYYRLLELKVNK